MTKTQPHRFKPIAVIITIAFATAVLAIANIVASNAVATTGKKLQQLHQQAEALRTQNQQLEQLNSQQKSLATIQAKAEQLGFLPIVHTLNLSLPKPLAQLP